VGINYQAAVNITAQYTGEQAIAKARRDIGSIDKSVSNLSGGLNRATDLLKTLAEAYAIKEATEFGKSIIDLADHLNELKQKTGIGIQTLSDLKSAAEDNGVQFDQLQSGLLKFSVAVNQAGSGSKDFLAAFKAAGVSVRDANGALKPSGELLLQLSERFSKLQDGPSKAALAVKLFGKSGADMIPLLNQGRAAIDGFGLKISDDFASRADEFNDSLNALKKAAQQFAVEGLTALLPALLDITEGVTGFVKASNAGQGEFQAFGETLKILVLGAVTLVNVFAEGADEVKTLAQAMNVYFSAVADKVVDQFNSIGSAIKAASHLNFDEVSRLNTAFYDRQDARDKVYNEKVKALDEGLGQRQQSRINKEIALNNALFNSQKRNKEALEKPDPNAGKKEKLDYAGSEQTAKLERERDAIAKYRIEQDKEVAAKLDDILITDKSTAAYQKEAIARKLRADAAKATVGFEESTRQAYLRSTEAIIDQQKALIDLAEAQKESIGRGAKQAFDEYVAKARDTASQFKTLFSNALQGVEDAIVTFVQTGKLSFADFARAVEADLIRIAVRKTIALGITAAASAFADGGVMTASGPVPLRKYASGGVASTPQLALFGEGSRPEAYVPLPDGRSIPVNMKAPPSGGDTTSVTVNVTIASDGSQKQEEITDSQKGKQIGQMISAAVKSELVNQKRPGGLLA
jgi:hypothetical protein